MGNAHPTPESSTLVTITGPGRDAVPVVVNNARGRNGARTCVALLTLARALARADAVRDRSLRICANDNDTCCDLRPL